MRGPWKRSLIVIFPGGHGAATGAREAPHMARASALVSVTEPQGIVNARAQTLARELGRMTSRASTPTNGLSSRICRTPKSANALEWYDCRTSVDAKGQLPRHVALPRCMERAGYRITGTAGSGRGCGAGELRAGGSVVTSARLACSAALDEHWRQLGCTTCSPRTRVVGRLLAG